MADGFLLSGIRVRQRAGDFRTFRRRAKQMVRPRGVVAPCAPILPPSPVRCVRTCPPGAPASPSRPSRRPGRSPTAGPRRSDRPAASHSSVRSQCSRVRCKARAQLDQHRLAAGPMAPPACRSRPTPGGARTPALEQRIGWPAGWHRAPRCTRPREAVRPGTARSGRRHRWPRRPCGNAQPESPGSAPSADRCRAPGTRHHRREIVLPAAGSAVASSHTGPSRCTCQTRRATTSRGAMSERMLALLRARSGRHAGPPRHHARPRWIKRQGSVRAPRALSGGTARLQVRPRAPAANRQGPARRRSCPSGWSCARTAPRPRWPAPPAGLDQFAVAAPSRAGRQRRGRRASAMHRRRRLRARQCARHPAPAQQRRVDQLAVRSPPAWTMRADGPVAPSRPRLSLPPCRSKTHPLRLQPRDRRRRRHTRCWTIAGSLCCAPRASVSRPWRWRNRLDPSPRAIPPCASMLALPLRPGPAQQQYRLPCALQCH